MVESNENFVIFWTLFVLSFSLPKFLPHFGVKPLFMLFMLLIAFQSLSSIIRLHMSAFLGRPLTIITCTPSILPISFFFNLMSTTNLSLDPYSIVSLGMTKLKGVSVLWSCLSSFSCFPKCCLLGQLLICWALSLPFLPIYLLCQRTPSKQVTYSFYNYSWPSYRLLYPTTRYFWTCQRWTSQRRATQLWAWVPRSCSAWRSCTRHSISSLNLGKIHSCTLLDYHCYTALQHYTSLTPIVRPPLILYGRLQWKRNLTHYLKNLLKDLGMSTCSTTLLYCDNQSVIYITHKNTSRLIVILSIIILSMMLSSCSQSPLKINLQISSPSHILRDVFMLWLTISSYSHTHLEFEGGF